MDVCARETCAQLFLLKGGPAPAVSMHCVRALEATETCFVLLPDCFGILLRKAFTNPFEATSGLNCIFSH